MLKYLTHKLRSQSISDNNEIIQEKIDEHDSGTESDGELENEENSFKLELDIDLSMSSRLDTLSPTDCSIESPATSIMTQTAHLLYDQHSSEEELEVINGPSSIAAAAAAALSLSSEDVDKILAERGTAESVASEASSIEPEVFETESISPIRPSSTNISETRKRSLPHSSDDEVRNLLESVPTPVNFRTSPPLEALKPNRNLNLMFRATTPLILTETSRGIENIKISCDSNSTKDSHNSSTQDFFSQEQNFDYGGACGGNGGDGGGDDNGVANNDRSDNIIHSHPHHHHHHHHHQQHRNNNHNHHHHQHHQHLNNNTNLIINNSTNNITTTNLSLTTQIETTNPNNLITSIETRNATTTAAAIDSPTASSGAVGTASLLNSNGIEKPPPFRLLEEKNFNINDRIGGIRHFNNFIPYHHNYNHHHHHQFYGNNSNTSSSITQLIPSNAVGKSATMVSISASSSDVRSISPPAKLFHCAISPRRRPSRTHHAPQRLQRPHRPCLDFDKMQQLKARSVSSWRQNEHSGELSVFCW